MSYPTPALINRILDMSPKQIANNFHKDLFSKVSISLITLITVGVATTTYGVFRANIVFASDLNMALDPIKQSVAEIKVANQETQRAIQQQTILIQQLAENQVEIRIDYLEDQVRILRSKSKLSNDEKFRLMRYQDDLEREKLKRGR